MDDAARGDRLGPGPLQWAQVVAFDEASLPALTVDDLLGRNPARLRLGLQPFITLLEMDYPLDDYVLAVKRRDTSLRSEASNAIEQDGSSRKPPRRARPSAARAGRRPGWRSTATTTRSTTSGSTRRRTRSCAPAGWQDAGGGVVALAVETSDSPEGEWTGKIQDWFAGWTRFGWFCHRQGRGGIRGRNDS